MPDSDHVDEIINAARQITDFIAKTRPLSSTLGFDIVGQVKMTKAESDKLAEFGVTLGKFVKKQDDRQKGR